jgi:hypothetical protein
LAGAIGEKRLLRRYDLSAHIDPDEVEARLDDGVPPIPVGGGPGPLTSGVVQARGPVDVNAHDAVRRRHHGIVIALKPSPTLAKAAKNCSSLCPFFAMLSALSEAAAILGG